MGFFSRLFGKGKKSELWSEFAGRKNDKPLLGEKAVALAPVLIKRAHDQARRIHQFIPALEANQAALFFELVIVNLHVMDRIAFEQLGPERRNWFMAPLAKEVVERLATLNEDEAKVTEFREAFWSQYADRMQNYATCTLVAEKNDRGESDIQRTIAWKLADVLDVGEDFITRMSLLIELSSHMIASFRHLRLRQLVGT